MDDRGRVHIVDDDAAVRGALDLLLRSAGYETALYASLDELVPMEAAASLGCLLLDIRMPGVDGLEFHETLVKRGIQLSVIMMTGYGDIPMTVRAMRAGAIDFLPKPFEEEQMLAAVAAAMDSARRRLALSLASSDLAARFATLTLREKQVMAFVTAGRLNKQTAYELGLSEITVKVHRRSAMRKMQAPSLADLVRMAELLHLTPERLAAGGHDAAEVAWDDDGRAPE